MPLKTAFEGVTYNRYVEGTEIERLWLLGESPTVPNEQVESRIPAISNARREWLARNAQALGRCDDGSALAAVAELSREEARGTSRVISALLFYPAADVQPSRLGKTREHTQHDPGASVNPSPGTDGGCERGLLALPSWQ